VGVWLLAGLAWPVALTLATVAMLAERFSARLDDNVAIVGCVGLATRLI
jgi:hypothetical protein